MGCAEHIVSALLEDDPKDYASDIDPDDIDENVVFSVRYLPCIEHAGEVWHLADFRLLVDGKAQPQFWTVYKRIHYFDDQGEEIEAPEFAVEDFDTEEEAAAAAARLKQHYEAMGKLIDDGE